MEKAITLERAREISRVAHSIVEGQSEIEKADKLIKRFETTPLREITIVVTAFPEQGDHACDVSVASAICLLREVIERKQQHVDKCSEWLRCVLSE